MQGPFYYNIHGYKGAFNSIFKRKALQDILYLDCVVQMLLKVV